MKRVIITVEGGVAEVYEEPHDVEVIIVNLDNGDEFPDPTEPEPGDYVFHWNGNLCRTDEAYLGCFPNFDDAWEAAKKDMDEQGVYPNCWSISDHGNYVLWKTEDYPGATGERDA